MIEILKQALATRFSSWWKLPVKVFYSQRQIAGLSE
jgi:hypothetical protein